MSTSAKTLIDKRVRRQKMFIAVGSVVLLAVVGFELPKVLGGHGNSGAGAEITAVQLGPVGSPPAAAAGALPNTDVVVVQPGSNQLVSFGLFKAKDPFVQQLSTSSAGASAASAPPPATPTSVPTSTKPSSTQPSSTQPSSPGAVVVVPQTALTPTPVPGAPTSPGSVTTPASPGTAPTATTPGEPTAPADVLLSTNGICERVAVDGTFPSNENIFRLVKIAPNGKSVEIGVAGGSFDDGQPTATLKQGDKLTLVNTGDGTRYEIALMSKCKVETQPAPGATGSTLPIAPTPSPSVPAATTSPITTTPATTTTTTPIVTDSLDPSPPTS